MRLRPDVVLLLALFAAAPAAVAADYTLSNGAVHFSAPDDWMRIMQTQGDPEAMVFQVPDPSPTGHQTLARVSVSSKRAADLGAFRQYAQASMQKARTLPGFDAGKDGGDATTLSYTAEENGVRQHYLERYFFEAGHAVQVRCVRPVATQAGRDWIRAFDAGCEHVAASF